MRKFGNKSAVWAVAGVAAAIVVAANAVHALAETGVPAMSCDAFATAAADTASKDFMLPAGAYEHAVPGKVLVIAAGRKFYMPPRQIDDQTLAPLSVWQRARAWNEAYSDAFWRCRYSDIVIINPQR